MKRFLAIFMMCASIVGLSAAINGTEMTADKGTKAAKAATKGTKKAGTKAEAKPVEQPVQEFDTDGLTMNLEELERDAIERAMRRADGNISRAAELLGITRYTLYRKLNK